MEEESWRRNHEGGIMKEESWRTLGEASGTSERLLRDIWRHLEGIWRHPGDTQEAPRRHPEAPRGTQKVRGLWGTTKLILAERGL